MKRPEKELWPAAGDLPAVTKAELADHYLQVAPRILPHLIGRPLTLVRAPNGIGSHRFYQKDAHHLPEVLPRCHVDEGLNHVIAEDRAGLVALADQACVELHGWTSRCDRPMVPDRLVFDLDPPDEHHFDVVKEAARTLCGLLASRGGTPFPMVTGSKGIHIVVPLVREADFSAITDFTLAVARVMAKRDPRLTTELRIQKREGRLFVDTLRNRRRQTSVVPWSTRARPGCPVAAPIAVADLERDDLHPQMCRLQDVSRWLEEDPWEGFQEKAVPLSRMV